MRLPLNICAQEFTAQLDPGIGRKFLVSRRLSLRYRERWQPCHLGLIGTSLSFQRYPLRPLRHSPFIFSSTL